MRKAVNKHLMTPLPTENIGLWSRKTTVIKNNQGVTECLV